MNAVTDSLPLLDTFTPDTATEVALTVRDAAENRDAIYPLGGQTSLHLGLPAKREGFGISLSKLSQVVDYPARDLTITVQAGITLAELQSTLAGESQRLPLDFALAEQATLGGLLATNFSGPRRFKHGTLRDHVIGIRAVDGCGVEFAGGGRVVKNVAGYDFCKLLTGSLGTLAIITEVTLKLKPLPVTEALLVCAPRDCDHAEQLLSALATTTRVDPVAIELLQGSAWRETAGNGLPCADVGWLVVALEGTDIEVAWMRQQLQDEWSGAGVDRIAQLEGAEGAALWQRMIEFPTPHDSPLVIKLTSAPSQIVWLAEQIRQFTRDVDLQVHAGNGIVTAKFHQFPANGLSRMLAGNLESAAAKAGGCVTILANPSRVEMTHHTVWGATDVPFWLMKNVKQAFDPHDILNPGRFVY